jgi:putative tryptophan/tyrosine transport system substrate-binding protein
MRFNRLKRREFIALLGGMAATWPLAAHTEPDRIRRIGMLLPYAKDDPEDARRREAFQEGLKQLGWIEGSTISIEYRWYGADSGRARSMVKELVARRPDVIVTGSTPGLMATTSETQSIPIVFVAVSDPVGQGFVASLAHPGGNATGFTYFEFPVFGKMVEMLKTIVPTLTRVAALYNPDNPANNLVLPVIEATASRFAVEPIRAPVHNSGEIEIAIAETARQPGSGVFCLPDTLVILHRELLGSLTARYRLPTISAFRAVSKAGGLVSYGVDIIDLYRRAASYVDLILKGAKPADLPVQQPTKFELVINLKTAKALGLEIPPTLLAVADEVIE